MRAPSGLTVCLLIATALSGCIAGQDDVQPPPEATPEACVGGGFCGEAVVDEAGRDLRVALTADDELGPPTWRVGDVFEQHLYYGEADGAGEHIQTMVVDDSGSCYQFGTTSQAAARAEAVYDLPILGCIDKDLSTGAFGTDWSWMYVFPLTDGKTWKGGVQGIFNWNSNTFHNYDFELTATYAAKIDTPKGDFPGFEIIGLTPDGETFLEYNYVPAVGWFSHFWMYDLATDVPDDIMFHAMSMGTSKGFTGTYYIDESETLVEEAVVWPFLVLETAQPTLSFIVPDDATHIQGVIAPIACPGVSKLILVTPDNQQEQYDHQYEGDPQACLAEGDGNPAGGAYTVHWVDRPAEAGEWRVTSVGAGVFGHFIWIEAVTEHAYELTSADVPQAGE